MDVPRSTGSRRPRKSVARLGASALFAVGLCALSFGVSQPADVAPSIDAAIAAELEAQGIRGVSLAIIDQGRIIAKGYGVAEEGGGPVTTRTLFQAGSISKPVAALAALHLVEKGLLSLDSDVNRTLKGWKLPDNDLTRDERVTLRRILSHSAGLTVHGFPGYDAMATMPTLQQVLDGESPANTAPIRVDVVPGSIWRYSGGGYTVMQQMMIDVTGKPFPELMRESVLGPWGMADSTYEQPLPASMSGAAATAYIANGRAVEHKWHLYPEMAAAGLWSTPTDLAKFAMAVQDSLSGKSNLVISAEMTRRLLTLEKGNSGLGLMLRGEGEGLRFMHGGRDLGFDAFLVAFAETGQGAAVMINANDNSGAMRRIIEAISKEYHWPAMD